MNKPKLVAAAVAAASFSLSVQAQPTAPNVTVYGIADVFLQSARGDGSLARVQSGGLSGSRLGFRGTEDLGSGLRAIYTLEAGFNADDGSSAQGGVLFGRQVFAGLRGGFGQITVGRQYSSLYFATGDFSAFTNGVYGASTALIGGFAGGYEPVRGAASNSAPPAGGATGNGGPARVNNSLRYESPSFGGLRAGVLYGFGEAAGATADQRLVDLFVRYERGAVEAILSHVDDRTAGANGTDVAVTTLAAAVAFGEARALAGVMNVDDGRAANQDGRGYWIGADYRIGSHLVRAQYVLNDPRFGTDNESRAIGVGYQYDFTRRTALYGALTRFDNKADAGSGGLGRWHTSIPTGLTSPADNDITELVVGLRHLF